MLGCSDGSKEKGRKTYPEYARFNNKWAQITIPMSKQHIGIVCGGKKNVFNKDKKKLLQDEPGGGGSVFENKIK